MRRLAITLLIVPLALALPYAVQAQDVADEELYPGLVHPAPLPNQRVINVVATGTEGHEGRDLHPIAILIDVDIRNLQGPDITRALRRLPGVSLTRNGGIGAFTGVSVRGAGSEQLLVLVDGMRVNDPASPGGGFDSGSLTTGELGKVELLRGPHSVVWGADAIAGVMNITSRTPDGLQAAAEYGGAQQFSADAAWGMQSYQGDLALSGGFTDAQGFSAAEAGTEDDGFRQWNLGARGRLGLIPELDLVAHARISDARTQIDGFPAPDYILADTLERQDTRRLTGHLGAEWQTGDTELSASVSYSRTQRDLVDEGAGEEPYFFADGETLQASAIGRHDFSYELSLDFGADWKRDTFLSGNALASNQGEAETKSAHALVTHEGDVSISAGLRFDDHSEFGGEWSLGAAGSVPIGRSVAVRASYGEGFKAPSLFQLQSEYGNLALRPERSRSYDIGVSWSPERRANVSLSLFRRDSDDLIDFTSCFGVTDGICSGRPFGTYDNLASARAQGVELEGDILFGHDYSGDFYLQGNWSYVAAENRTQGSPNSGNRLARRPRHTANLSATWRPDSGLFSTSFGVDFRYASASFDDAANSRILDSHALLDIRVSRPVLELARGQRTLYLTARIENIWDEQYQTGAGYAAQGRAVFVGLRARM